MYVIRTALTFLSLLQGPDTTILDLIMKRFLLSLSFCLCAFILISCEKPNNEEPIAPPEDNASYYVKYEASSTVIMQSITVNTDTGKQTFTVRKKTYSETFGPVSKGFDASVNCQAAANVSIYVCKDNGPFALKASGGESATYTIDF